MCGKLNLYILDSQVCSAVKVSATAFKTDLNYVGIGQIFEFMEQWNIFLSILIIVALSP